MLSRPAEGLGAAVERLAALMARAIERVVRLLSARLRSTAARSGGRRAAACLWVAPD